MRRPLRVLQVGTLALMVATDVAHAQSLQPGGDVEDFRRLCKMAPQSLEGAACFWYIGGAADQLQGERLLCAGSATYSAMVQAFLNWTDKNPDKWDISRRVGVMAALVTTWPCRAP